MLQLIILGLLCEGDRHPYEVMQIVKERNMEAYIKINFGTLYYNFDKLLEQGHLEVREVIQEEKRPDKTIYRITEQGRARFAELLTKQFYDNPPIYHPLYPALMFAKFSSEDEIRDALLKRREHQEGFVRTIEEKMDLLAPYIHWSSVQIMKNGRLHALAEIEWIDQYLEELQKKGTVPEGCSGKKPSGL